MARIGVLEHGQSISDYLRAALTYFGVQSAEIFSACDGESYDVVVIGIDAPFDIPTCDTNILIIPDCINATGISQLTANSVVSYGLCKKNTLTVSSLIGSRLVVSIQREISTICGDNVGEQELCINIQNFDSVDMLLGIITTLLVADISPEAISKGMSFF